MPTDQLSNQTEREDTVFVTIREDDFDEVQLCVGKGDSKVVSGRVPATPGKYILVREEIGEGEE